VVLGALCFLASTEARRHGCKDLRLAEGLALRAAHAIDNARLYRTAQRAVRARDEVLGIVAHDLRNPLSAVLMQAQLLRPRLVDPDQRTLGAIDSIRRAVVRMNRMIEDLLDATRMEAGRLAVDLGSVAPAPLVADVIETQRPLAAAASIELVAEAHEQIPEVLADRDRLQQILENLIGNAIKFTAGGGRVTLQLTLRNDDVVFAVVDNGTGIAAEDLPHVFDRFWQGKRQGQRGAGLGLQIVKGLVEAHGGRIWVDSAVGTGTTFSFALRVAPPTVA
jgi:signal transduction histidine kinase